MTDIIDMYNLCILRLAGTHHMIVIVQDSRMAVVVRHYHNQAITSSMKTELRHPKVAKTYLKFRGSGSINRVIRVGSRIMQYKELGWSELCESQT